MVTTKRPYIELKTIDLRMRTLSLQTDLGRFNLLWDPSMSRSPVVLFGSNTCTVIQQGFQVRTAPMLIHNWLVDAHDWHCQVVSGSWHRLPVSMSCIELLDTARAS